MVRCFDNDNVVHVDGSVDPVRDKDVIDTELQLKDAETLQKRLDKLKRQIKSMDKQLIRQHEIATRLLAHIEEGNNARSFPHEPEEIPVITDFYLLTWKPVMYVCNVDEDSVVDGNAYTAQIKELVKNENAEVLLISAVIEADIAELETYEERMEFLDDLGLSEPGVNKVIKACYQLLNLITYFTAGEKEVRAWTVKVGSKAPQAAGVIHSDFERGFIRAEVIKYADYIKYGSESGVRDAGKMSVEGKEYVVTDGDIMHFRHNT